MRRAWVLGVVAVIVLGYALATGHPMFWRSFYVFTTLLLLSALWLLVVVVGIEVEVRRAGLRAQAGGDVRTKVSIRRRNRFQRGWVEIRDQTDIPGPVPSVTVDLSESESISLEIDVPCPKRGMFKVGPSRVIGSDPFGLFQIQKTIGKSETLTVHPATFDLQGFILLPADLPGEGPRHVRSNQVTTSAFGVREHAHGDGLNRISWKATAHHNQLMVKEFEMEPANNVWVVLDMERKTQTGSGDDSTEETAVSVAASICKRYLDANYPVGFMAVGNDAVLVPSQRGRAQLMHILDSMAGLRALGNRPLLDLIANLDAHAGPYTSVAVVTPDPKVEWLEGVGHLLERRSRVTVTVIDGDLPSKEHPESAIEAAAMGVPTYVVKRGRQKQRLEALTAGAQAHAPRPERKHARAVR